MWFICRWSHCGETKRFAKDAEGCIRLMRRVVQRGGSKPVGAAIRLAGIIEGVHGDVCSR